MYKINNIDLAAVFGFIPGQRPDSNLAVSGCWDMPARIGKTHHDWGDEDGIEPYVSAEEIRFGGRDIVLSGLIKGDDPEDGLRKLYDFYDQLLVLDTYYALECDWGMWNVFVNGEIKAEWIETGGWYTVEIPFRQPIVDLSGDIPEPSDLSNDLGIDSRSFQELGFIFLRLDEYAGRPAPKGLTRTVWPQEPWRINRVGHRTIKMKGIFVTATYNEFTAKLQGLYALLSCPGLRNINKQNDALRKVFVKDQVKVDQVYISSQNVMAVIEIEFTEAEKALIDWTYLADTDGNIIIDSEGNKILVFPDGQEIKGFSFLADSEGNIIIDSEGNRIIINI